MGFVLGRCISSTPDITLNISVTYHKKTIDQLKEPTLKTVDHLKHTVINMSHFAYACKTEGISRLISTLCVNSLSSIPEYSRLNHLDVYLV